jgi:TM2 domain-containing membrane protein YozV
MVTLVDTDSFQVRDSKGIIHRCPVGVPEYTPPELQGTKLDTVDRNIYHDGFGLGVIIFQLLMEGFHPFTGAPRNPTLSIFGEIYLHCIKQGIFPYQSNNQFAPPPNAPNFTSLHPEVQSLFLRCFVNGHLNPSSRPSAREWLDSLDKAEKSLVQCSQNPSHWYSSHVGKCSWCERERQRPLPVQNPLPPPTQVTPRPVYTPPPPTNSKSPIGAALLSFFLLGGAGQIYLGQTGKGIAIIVVNLVASIIPGLNLLVVGLAVADAYGTAQKINQGISVGDWEFSINKTALIVVLLLTAVMCLCVFVAYLLPSLEPIINSLLTPTP